MKRTRTRIEYMINDFWSSFAVSLVTAAFSFIFFPGAQSVSALLTLVWVVLVALAFTKFKLRAFWFLLGTPLVGYWLLVMCVIAYRCGQNVKNCP